MKMLRIMLLFILMGGFFTACSTIKVPQEETIPNPEVNTGGTMGGGTGTGTLGDDPTMPEN